MAATFYIRIELEWDYVHRTVTLPMPSYVRKHFYKFHHIIRGGKYYSPHTCTPIQYGQRFQYADPLDAADYHSEKETNLVQQVCGTFWCYSVAIDNIIILALSNTYSEQYKATKNTATQAAKLLNYLASNTHAEI